MTSIALLRDLKRFVRAVVTYQLARYAPNVSARNRPDWAG
jgi:hypothetical protein